MVDSVIFIFASAILVEIDIHQVRYKKGFGKKKEKKNEDDGLHDSYVKIGRVVTAGKIIVVCILVQLQHSNLIVVDYKPVVEEEDLGLSTSSRIWTEAKGQLDMAVYLSCARKKV